MSVSIGHVHPLVDTILQIQKEQSATGYIMIGYCRIADPNDTSVLNLLRVYTDPLKALEGLAKLLDLDELPDWMREGGQCLLGGDDYYRAGDNQGFQYLIIPARKFDHDSNRNLLPIRL